MAKYIYLDAWVLSQCIHASYAEQLASFIQKNEYTIIINGFLLTELYNPGWEHGGERERGASIVRFLEKQHCAIIEPEKIWNEEAAAFPGQLTSPPINLDLDTIPLKERGDAILSVLRRAQELLANGIDIKTWDECVKVEKGRWLVSVEKILAKGVLQGQLVLTKQGRYQAVDTDTRGAFLCSLDRRLPQTTGNIQFYIADNTSEACGIRFSNLCFWHRYVDPPPNALPSKQGSDLGDILQMSLLPYCHAFTLDTKMKPTVALALKEAFYPCQLLTQRELGQELGIE